MAYLQSSMVVGKLWRSLFIFLHNNYDFNYEQTLSWAFPVPALALLVVLFRAVTWVAAVPISVAGFSFPGFSSIVYSEDSLL